MIRSAGRTTSSTSAAFRGKTDVWSTKRKSGLVMTLSYDQVRRPVYKSALARWKRYEKHLGPLQSLIGDLVKEYDA